MENMKNSDGNDDQNDKNDQPVAELANLTNLTNLTDLAKIGTNGARNIVHSSEKSDCVELLIQVQKGKVWLLPAFAQSLFTYLQSDISDDPRAAVNSIAVKGMFILNELQSLHEKEKEEENRRQIAKKEARTDIRDIVLLSIGYSSATNRYICSMIGVGYLIMKSNFYNTLKFTNKAAIAAAYIAYILYCIQNVYSKP